MSVTLGKRPLRRHPRLLQAVEIATPVLVIIALLVWTGQAGIYYFPPLAPILLDFVPFWFSERLWTDFVPSVSRLSLGYLIAVAVGIPAGLLLGRYPRVRATFTPVLEFIRAIPAPALIPLVILVVGIGDDAKVALIAVVCIWPILLNAMDGATGMEPVYIETSTVYRIDMWRRFTHVVLPAAAPQIFAGMRTALALALIMVVVSEMAASQNGIGHVILVSQRTFALADMWSGIILLGLLGFTLNLLFVRLERVILAWHHGSRDLPQ